MKRIALLVMSLFILSACVQDGQTLTIFTADPNVAIHFKLLPPPLPTITPAVVPCLEIKGNISASGEKIAHSPGQANYDSTVIDESKGEKLFCTLQDAIDAGWRPAQR